MHGRRRSVPATVLAVGLVGLPSAMVAACADADPDAGGETRPGAVSTTAAAACPGTSEPPAPVAPATAAPPILPRPGSAQEPAAYALEVVARLPHDPMAFTQGLVYDAGRLVEGTGGFGTSEIRAVDPATGRVQEREELPTETFGEGVAVHGDRVYQLTWTDEVGYVRDRCTLAQVDDLSYEGEGWGLASDGEVLWRSDGSDVLAAHDPDTFEVVQRLEVTDRGVPLDRLNELEVVDGDLLANVWLTEYVARIDLETGAVVGWVDGGPLVEDIGSAVGSDEDAVLNGIAADATGGRLWLTGKRWPALFEVRLVAGGDLPEPGAP